MCAVFISRLVRFTYMRGVYFSFSLVYIMPSKHNRAAAQPSDTRTQSSTFTAGTCNGSSNYNFSSVSTALMEQLHSLSIRMLCTQLKGCSLPTLGSRVAMAARLHNCFHASQGTPSLNPNNAVIPPQDPNRQQQQATETSPPAGNNLFSQQFANQLSPGNNLFFQQFASLCSNLLYQFMVQTPSQQSQAVQSNHRNQLADSNSHMHPVDASNQVPSTSNQLPSTSNQLLGDNGEEESSEPSIIQPIGPNPARHHTLWLQPPSSNLPPSGNLSSFQLNHNHGLQYNRSYSSVS